MVQEKLKKNSVFFQKLPLLQATTTVMIPVVVADIVVFFFPDQQRWRRRRLPECVSGLERDAEQ